MDKTVNKNRFIIARFEKSSLALIMAAIFSCASVHATDAYLKNDNESQPKPTAPNLPQPNAILQGSDNCENFAELTGDLPISSFGSTVGYSNDYDISTFDTILCWQGGFIEGSGDGPDVVYKFTAPAESSYTFSLCGSNFDTGLELYRFTCPVEPNSTDFICGNDDSENCDTLSELVNIELSAGDEILIVVDGYDTHSGEYELVISFGDYEPRPGCPEETPFGQDAHFPEYGWSAATSDAGSSGPYLVFDNFQETDIIGGIRFWGLDLTYPWAECWEDPMAFEIIFYDDDDGVPGNEMGTYIVDINPRPLGLLYSGFQLNEYTAQFVPYMDISSGWISIQGISDPQDCWFLWMSGDGIDGHSYQWDGSEMNHRPYDQAFCLTAGLTGIEEAGLLPAEIDMLTSYPNPFNIQTTISFSLNESGYVCVNIHDLLGRRVAILDMGYLTNDRVHSATFNAAGLSSGVYYYSLIVDDVKKTTRKFSLLK